MTSTLKCEDPTKLKFDKLNLDLRVQTGTKRTHDGLLNLLMDFFKINYKGEKIKKLE